MRVSNPASHFRRGALRLSAPLLPATKARLLTPFSSYEFGVLQPGTMQTTPQQCKITVLGLPDGKLPEVGPWEGKCEQTSKTFSVARDGENLVLTVSQPVSPASNTTGVHTITADQLKMDQSGASVRQSYTGPTAFPLEFVA